MNKLKTLSIVTDKFKLDAKALLEESIELEPDAVIVLVFHKASSTFQIKCSAAEERVKLVGALEEAKHKLITDGWIA